MIGFVPHSNESSQQTAGTASPPCNVGNLPLAHAAGAASFLSEPATKNFAILAGPQNDCLAATSLEAGAACEFVAEFAPPAGTAAEELSDAASIDSSAVDSAALRGGSGPLFSGGAALAGLPFCCFGFRRRRALWKALLVIATVAGAGMISGCGVQFNPGAGTMVTTVMVNASSGALQSSASLTLTVQRYGSF